MNLLVNIDVDDLDQGIRFYTTAFGLRIGRRFGAFGAELLGASTAIYLLVKAEGTPASSHNPQQRRYDRHWTPVHFDVVVDDIEAAVNAALVAGGTLEDQIATHKWGRIAHMADPFGHGFCVVQFLGRGYDEIAHS
jgi:predicted enzyme related to lactoylglutathione lyase